MGEHQPVRGRRRGPLWVRVSYGVHRPAQADDLEAILAAWQLVLPPSGRFTHLTAAQLLGWWLPPIPDPLPVFTAQARSESRPQRPGLVVARHADPAEPARVGDIKVDPPEEVLLQCARHLGLVDLVVLADAALHSGATTVDRLEAAARRRRRGSPMLRRAIPFADGRSESAWETLLRMLHVACGIEVEPQHRLLDGSGTELARADLWLVGTNALHEYDGATHLERRRQRSDLARGRRIGNVHWVRRGYTSIEVLHQAVGILRDADLSLGREHDPARVRRLGLLVAPGDDGTGGGRHQDSA
jgi:hypothetical protein